MSGKQKKILRIDASMRKAKSVSRRLADELILALDGQGHDVDVTIRDLTCGIGLVNEAWILSARTVEERRTQEQRVLLAQSDALVSELQEADDIVIAVPIYNFSVPAAFKAWIDLVCRNGITFAYENGESRGLLSGKRAFVIVTSGGTHGGSRSDFSTGYIKHVLNFIGIDDVTLIDATGSSQNRHKVISNASEAITKIAKAEAIAATKDTNLDAGHDGGHDAGHNGEQDTGQDNDSRDLSAAE
ncbi:NAD(P)H-dependent oxidoreductase [Alphaproteobacteria bacterium]|jgi:FMN-dependent NADH-azoreductase|nr:NAD(P)H-dependent oxidoreductase [Alphaproteobacteria bacterium]